VSAGRWPCRLPLADAMGFYVECPACGGLIEAATESEVVALAAAHTVDAHAYEVPEVHVRARVQRACGAPAEPPGG
jgi:hypothetical protein